MDIASSTEGCTVLVGSFGASIDDHRPCGEPAVIRVAFAMPAECTHLTPMASYCEFDWSTRDHYQIGDRHACGFGHIVTVLEIIDLSKADPGPGYADMLRSL